MHFDIKNIVANQIGLPGLILDEVGKILFFNSAASAALPGLQIEKEFSPFLKEESREKFLNSLSKIRSLNLPDNFTSALSNQSDKNEFNFDLTPVYNGKERVVLTTFNRDSKSYQLSLTSYAEEIIAKNRQLSKTVSFIRSNYPFTLVDKINLQTEIDELQGIFFIKYPDGKFIAVNKFFADILEAPVEKIIGKKDIDFLPRASHNLYEAVRSFVKNSGASIILDNDFMPGIEKGIHMIEFPIKNIDNEAVAIVAFTYKEEMKAPPEVTTSDDLSLKTLIEIIPNPVVIYDAETFQILNSNERAADLYKYSKIELREIEITDLYLPEEVQSLIEKSSSGEETTYNGIYHHKTNSGQKVEVEIRRSKIIYEGKEAFLVFINPLKSVAENEQEDAKEELNGDFQKFNPALLSQVFHEILNPLNIIVGFAQELVRGINEPTDEQNESIRLINSNHQRLMQRIDDVMEYSILRQKVVDLKKEKIDIPDFFEDLKAGLENYLSSTDNKVVEGKISDSLSVESDPAKLKSFLKSLIKTLFSTTGEEKIYISIYKFDEENFIIGIKNNSLNISSGFTKTISSIFTDEELSLQGVSTFTISLLRKILKLLSGSIQLVMKSGEPVEFGILFPLLLDKDSEAFEQEFIFKEDKEEPLDLEVAEAVEETPEETEVLDEEDKSEKRDNIQESVSEEDSIEMEEIADNHETDGDELEKEWEDRISGLTCLYIEDEIDSQMLFEKKMSDLKEINFAFELENAIKLVRENDYDFILVDINLEGEYNGLDALRIIHRLPGKENIPVIATTAYEMQGDREKYISAGFSAYLSKPIIRESLITILKKLDASQIRET